MAKNNGKTASKIENPYRVGGGYWATVEALVTLGVGKMHPQSAVISAVKKAMGDGWKAFSAKENRNEETGKDAEQRIWQNTSVCSRKDYGKPLRDKGHEVRFDGRGKVAGLFALNGKGQQKPQTQSGAKPEAIKAAKAPKVASKVAKPQPKAKAAKKAK